MTTSDLELVARAQAGDADAFAVLVERHRAAIVRLARRFVSRVDDAHDLAQETFVSAFVHLGTVRDGARFGAWLRRIAVNAALQWQRREAQLSLEILWDEPRADSLNGGAPSVAATDRVCEIVRDAVASLPPDPRCAVLLHYFDGYDYSETAALLDVPVSTVRGRLHLARHRLRAEMRELAPPGARIERRRQPREPGSARVQTRSWRMKFTCSHRELYEALQGVTRAVSGRSTLPILSNVLMEAGGQTVKLAATDLELAIERSFPASVSEPGPITVPARMMLEIVSQLPEMEVTVAVDDRNTAVVTCRGSQYRILGLPPEEFPALPTVGADAAMEIPQGELRSLIRSTAVAACTDDTRPVLTGICTTLAGSTLRMAATDFYRLAVRSCQVSGVGWNAGVGRRGSGVGGTGWSDPAAPSTDPVGPAPGPLLPTPAFHPTSDTRTVIIPARTLAEVLRVLHAGGEEPVRVRLDANQIMFSTATTTLVSRLIEGQFPPFERHIPTTYTTKLTISLGDFQQALRRALIVARENANRVVLRTDGENLTVTAQAGHLGEAYEELEVVREGDDIEMAFNARYLLDALGVLDSQGLYFEATGQNAAAVLRPADGSDYVMVIMPQRLQ